MSVNNPIINAGLKYVSGLQIAKTAAKTLSMAAGAARNSTNINDIVLDAAVTCNGAAVGVNGVDLAALGASSFYAVFLIGDSTQFNDPASLLSLSSTAPSLPAGYDMFRRVGYVLTDGSSNILQFWQYGNNNERTMYYDVAISELSGGTSATYAALDLATSVPPIDCLVIMNGSMVASADADTASFLPYGSSATAGIVVIGAGQNDAAQAWQVTVPSKLSSSVPTIQYKMSASASLTLGTIGYVDSL